ncbi:glycosyltransferase family 2 protein [Sphingomonas arantia]|uniref:Glycosyltransferase family 2 protein n=1 Tax=Sphingomonas arantia TaxID=1460676 RepID=A0ABW4U1C0_9SPHN
MTPSSTPATMLAVIVNYRTADLVIDCLESLVAEVAAIPGLSVCVVDNASNDGSDERIAAAIAANGWHGWATLIAAPTNGGFAAGNNVAIRPALTSANPPDLCWLLNPDTRVQPGATAAILDFFADHPAVGIAGTALVEEDGSPWHYAFRFHSVLSELERGARLGPVSRLLSHRAVLRPMGDRIQPVDWVSGASMIVRRGVFEMIGLMDERYFLYYEETDFCRRAARAGWPTCYLPQASVMHIAGQSTGLTGPRPALRRVPDYWFESRRRYFLRHHGRAYAALADAAWLAGHVGWRLRRWLFRRPDPDPPRLIRDFLRHSALFPRAAGMLDARIS